MISAKERWIIMNNIIARSGGIDKVNLASEFAKTIATITGMEAQDQMLQKRNMAAMAPPPPEPVQPPAQPTEGQGTLNLP